MLMALTRTELKLKREAERIAVMTKLDFWNVEKVDKRFRNVHLSNSINHMVLGEVITQYILLDEVLTVLICRYYFKKSRKRFLLWRRKNFRIFVNFILDETYLIKKMEVIQAFKPLPSEVRSIIHKVNSVRNAMAHSFFPENRKEYRKVGKVMYSGKDIRRSEGLEKFMDECNEAWEYLARRAYGVWNDVTEGKGKWD